ncbi:MAG: hypothetical protein M3Z16_08765, partial [Pseudomonadota bacterium]|nr:hypothetical protein [Pseudomonadota bacterium]
MIKRLLGLIFNRWVLLAVVLAAIALVIWLVGPLVAIAGSAPLESEAARRNSILVVVALFALGIAWS